MIFTTSNVLANVTPTVTTGVSTDLPKNITDLSFSVNYTSSDSQRLTIDFGATGNINYIAVAGINIEGDKSGSSRVRVLDGSTLIRTINVVRNQCVVIQFPEQSFTNLRIGLFNGAATTPPMISYAAAGVAITIPNGGEMSGYDRQYLKRNFKNRTTTSNLAAPVSQLRKRTQAKGTFNKPNVTREFSEETWQTFLDFAEENHFFISEQDDVFLNEFTGTNPSSYLCYDVSTNKVTAHNSTRALNNVSISYMVYNGL